MQEMLAKAVAASTDAAELLSSRHVRLDLPLGYIAAADVLNDDQTKINLLGDIIEASGGIWFNVRMLSLEVVAISILVYRKGLSSPAPEEYAGPLFSQHELRSGRGFIQVYQIERPTLKAPGNVTVFFRQNPAPQ